MPDAGHRAPGPDVTGILDQLSDAVVALDAELRCTFVNRRAAEILGRAPQDVLGRQPVELFPAFAGTSFEAVYRQVLEQREAATVEGFFAPLDRWFEQRVLPAADGGIVAVIQDVTARKAAERELIEREERYRLVTDSLSDAFWRRAPDGRPLQEADWEAVLGEPARGRAWTEIVHPDDLERVSATWRTALETGRSFDITYRVQAATGTRHVRARGVPLVRDGVIAEWVGVLFDVTDETTAAAALRRAAEQDRLTGLASREVFIERLRMTLTRRSPRAAVLFVDLDRFKAINDRFGHACGDDVLRATATRIRAILRPSDVVSRLSGDEFAILCEDLGDDDEAIAIGRRLTDALARPLESDERIQVTASIGVALADGSDADVAGLLRAADTAMYHAKARGGSCVEVFDDDLRRRAQQSSRIEAELRRGLDSGALDLHFQPIVSLDPRGSRFEALLRWRCEDGSVLPAAQAIAVAERTGLIHPIGREVLRQACAQASAWRRAGTNAGVTVNVSARQLIRHEDLVRDVREALVANDLVPDRLTLEITETVLMEDMDQGEAALEALHALGVRLAIDDFGVGYSSLSYLRRLPVDAVKLDRSFVSGLPDEQSSARIVEAVVGLGRAFGIRVVAEGVETHAQLEALRAIGCHAVQGYLLARPAPVEDAVRGLARAAATARNGAGPG